MNYITYNRQHLDKDDLYHVKNALKSRLLTTGEYTLKFENSLKRYFKSKYCVSLNSGTAGLHLAGKALGWNNKSCVFVPAITFVASLNSVFYNSAKPILVDINLKDYTIDLDKLEYAVKNKKNVKDKTVIIVDYAGHPADWKNLLYLSKKYNLKLVNDNCHAIGASYNDDIGYAVKYADIVVQSYHPVKNITTGEGGSVLTNNKYFYEKIKLLRSHAMYKDKKCKKIGNWRYDINNLGFNYRMSDINSALGYSQLKKLNKFVSKRNNLAQYYYDNIKSNNIVLPIIQKNIRHAYHLFPVRINFSKIEITKKKLFQIFESKKILLQVHYCPLHYFKFYKKKFSKKNNLKNAEKFYSQEVSLPLYYDLKHNQIDKILNILKDLIN